MTNHLPFEPGSVKIDDLAQRLEDVEDEEIVHALQRADTRIGAAAVYERRIDALREAQGSEEAAPEEAAPEEVAPELSTPAEASESDDHDDEDRARGYRITQWAGHPNYECLDCPFKHLDESKVIRHRAIHP